MRWSTLASIVNLGDLSDPEGGESTAEVAEGAAEVERFLVGLAAGQRIAVPLQSAREILTVRAVTRLPGAPSWIAGLVNVRGAVLTVVDLSRRLGATPAAGPVLLVEVGERRFGLRLDGVVGVARASAGLMPVDEARSAGGAVSGLVTIDDAATVVLDLAALQRAAIAEA